MATAQQMLALMASQIGYLEKNSRNSGPGNGNWTKYADEAFPAAQNQPWCATSEAWGFMKIGMTDMQKWIVSCWANCAAMERRARKDGMWISRYADARPGDLIIWDLSGVGHGTHTGVLERKISSSIVQDLEGNTSPGNAGSQSNGGGYYRRRRNVARARGFIRPPYSGTPAKVETKPIPVVRPKGKLLVDGDFGPNTQMAVAASVGLKEITSKREFWRAVQRWAGLTGDDVDGELGGVTSAAIARRIGDRNHPAWSSKLVSSWQTWLNENGWTR